MLAARIIGLIIGYLAGLFQTGVIYGKLKHTDLRKSGSGNTGMTNSIRVMGWKAGVIVFAGDCLKCVIAMVVTWLIFRKPFPGLVQLLELYAGLGCILGNNYPFYLKFKGGKGIAASVGLVCAFDFRMVPICALLFFLCVVPTGFMSLGSLAIMGSFFVQTVIFGQLGLLRVASEFLPETYVVAAVITAIAFWRHRENIARLIRGEENKFAPGSKKK